MSDPVGCDNCGASVISNALWEKGNRLFCAECMIAMMNGEISSLKRDVKSLIAEIDHILYVADGPSPPRPPGCEESVRQIDDLSLENTRRTADEIRTRLGLPEHWSKEAR